MRSKLSLILLICLLLLSGCSSTANNTESIASNTESKGNFVPLQENFQRLISMNTICLLIQASMVPAPEQILHMK